MAAIAVLHQHPDVSHIKCWLSVPKISESALLAEYVSTYRDFYFLSVALSVLTHRTVYRKIETDIQLKDKK